MRHSVHFNHIKRGTAEAPVNVDTLFMYVTVNQNKLVNSQTASFQNRCHTTKNKYLNKH